VFLALAAACSDRNPVGPGPVPPEPAATLAKLACRVDVAQGRMECAPATTTSGAVQADMIIGGQDLYVKLASSGTSYDGGTEILSSTVTVQNLLQQSMGTPDGTTVEGVQVFFESGPTVTSGTGSVSVANADGTGTCTSGTQPYFLYDEILSPYQISAGKSWRFNVSPTVVAFTFTLYVNTPLTSEASGVLVGTKWDGSESSEWTNALNWVGDSIPTAASTVVIPPASQLGVGASMPVLTANASVANLRVGAGSTLGLAGFTLMASGNVDAVGTVSGGALYLTGTGTLLNGNGAAVMVSGSTSLQGSTKTSGAVAVTGALAVKDQALTISIP